MLRSNGVESNACDSRTATEVAFYTDSFRLGQDLQAPFEFTWNLVPGEAGVPTSGNKDMVVYAVTNIHGLIETPKLPIRVTVTTP
jgi:hypothetical protein